MIKSSQNQQGAVPILILIAIIGLVSFLLFSSTLPFKDKLLSTLFPKQFSHASNLSFVSRNGTDLMLDGQKFRASGPNIYWLGLDEYPMGYPTRFRTDDALSTAKEMGATVVRSHTLGASVGCPLCIEPTLGNFNESAFESIDYAIKTASDKNIRLIIPLVDNYHYFMGGKHTFTEWRGLTNEDDFYTNVTVLEDYKNYISHVLNHVNQYTGIALKDDPTILTWETGNELDTATLDWSQKIAEHIKSITPKQLVTDGRYLQGSDVGHFNISAIDLYTDHFYPMDAGKLKTSASLTKNAGKAFFVGEYDWNSVSGNQAQGSISQDTTAQDGSFSPKVTVTQAVPVVVDSWFIQLLQSNVLFENAHPYTITFWAKASANRAVRVAINQNNSPYALLMEQGVDITTSWQKYSLTFTPPVAQTNTLFSFNYAGALGDVWIDNVVVSDGGPNLIQNPSFETTGTNWLNPWTFTVKQVPASSSLADFISTMEDPANGVSASLYWELFPHADLNGFIPHENFTLHYTGDTQSMKDKAKLLRKHAYAMSGVSVPADIIPQAPLLWQPKSLSSGVNLRWRGIMGADSYNMERSTNNNNWSVVATNLSDNNTPWTDPQATPGNSYYYRIQPVNISGVKGAYSNTVSSASLLENGNFEYPSLQWLSGWITHLKSETSAQAIFTKDTTDKTEGLNSIKVDVQNTGGTYWYVQLLQDKIPFVAGKTYTIQFSAKASSNRSISTTILQGYSPYTTFTEQPFNITTSWQPYSFTFNPTTSEQNAQIAFNLAYATGQVWLDNISICNGSCPNLTATPQPSQNPSPSLIPSITPSSTPITTDTVIPSVSITTPVNNTFMNRNTNFVVSASASDNIGVSKVEFYIDSNLKATDGQSPYSITTKIGGKSGAKHTITAKAYDSAGNNAQSSVVVTTK